MPPSRFARLVRLVRDLGIAEMEADAVAPRRLEQRRRLVAGQRLLEPLVRLGPVGVPVAREERRQRELGEDDQLDAPRMRPLHQPHHARDRDRSRLRALDRPELGGGDGEDAAHGGDGSPDLPGDRAVHVRPAMRGEVEHLLLALAAGIEVAIGDDHLVAQRRSPRPRSPVRVDDAGAADQPGAVLVARLGDGDRPGRVHVGVGLRHQRRVEGAQRRHPRCRRHWGRRRRSCSRRRPAPPAAGRARARLPASGGRCRSACPARPPAARPARGRRGSRGRHTRSSASRAAGSARRAAARRCRAGGPCGTCPITRAVRARR